MVRLLSRLWENFNHRKVFLVESKWEIVVWKNINLVVKFDKYR